MEANPGTGATQTTQPIRESPTNRIRQQLRPARTPRVPAVVPYFKVVSFTGQIVSPAAAVPDTAAAEPGVSH